jgi:glutaredoxin-like protein NrdH
MAPDIRIYALSTCIHCKHAKEYLEKRSLPYRCIHVDTLEGEERAGTMAVVRRLNPSMSFPTIVIGKKVIVGFHQEQIDAAIEECADQ